MILLYETCTYDTACGSSRTANSGKAGAIVPRTGHKNHIVLLHSLRDHFTNPPGKHLSTVTNSLKQEATHPAL